MREDASLLRGCSGSKKGSDIPSRRQREQNKALSENFQPGARGDEKVSKQWAKETSCRLSPRPSLQRFNTLAVPLDSSR